MTFLRRTVAVLLALGVSQASAVEYYKTEFSGNPPITARWAFEPWVWEDNAWNTANIEGLVDGYKSRNIPTGATIIDSPWSTAYNNFQFDTARYSDPAAMISHLRSEGVRVVMWTTGMINQSSIADGTPLQKHPQFDYVRAQNYQLKNPSNGNDVFSWWRGNGMHVDFTNPAAADWFMSQSDALVAMGISGFKVDESDNAVSSSVQTSAGSVFGGAAIPRAQHSAYYHGAISDWTRANVPNNEGVILARPYDSGTYSAPISKLTAGWCGDYGGDFAGFKAQISSVYTSAQAGYGAVGFEIGGFKTPKPTHDSLLRQAEFAALLPIMENGGENGGLAEHLPWHWDANGYTNTVDTYRYYATLHHNLAPFLFHSSVVSNLDGTPMVTQTDAAAYRHVLGGAILTQAVTAAGSRSVTVNLPAGDKPWINWWDHSQVFDPGTSTTDTYTIDKAPIFVRAGSIIPMNVDNDVTGLGDADSAGKDLSVLIFPYDSSALSFYRALGDGTDYENIDISSFADFHGGQISVAGPTSLAYRFVISSITEPEGVTGVDSWFYDFTNQWIIVDKTGSDFSFSYETAPEPATIVLLAVASGAFGLWRLRVRRAARPCGK